MAGAAIASAVPEAVGIGPAIGAVTPITVAATPIMAVEDPMVGLAADMARRPTEVEGPVVAVVTVVANRMAVTAAGTNTNRSC